VTTREVPWRGWEAVEQSNGLVTLRHVPSAGGRTLSLEIGGDDAIAVFTENEGKVYPLNSHEGSVHFGGHYVAIGPETRWNVNDQPLNPHGGPYRYTIDNARGDAQSVTMRSRPDAFKGLTVSMERTITMRRGTTHVTIEEEVTNRGPDPIDFYIWDFTQIDALHHDRPGRPMRNLTLYVPLPPKEPGQSRYTHFLPPDPAKDAQFDASLPTDVLAIHYRARMFKIASHPESWWVAAVDHDTGWTYVKAFEPDRLAQYVDGNAPVEVYGSAMHEPRPSPFVEMELLSGIKRYRPGAGPKQREDWYATVCYGPVLAFSEAGVVCEAMKLKREGKVCLLTGRYGVFYLGTAQVVALDLQGQEIGHSEPIFIDPRKELHLNTTVKISGKDVPDMFVMRIFNADGDEVGVLDRYGVR